MSHDAKQRIYEQFARVLHAARLVESRRDGQRIFYRLAGPAVEALWLTLRGTAEAQLAELPGVARAYLGEAEALEPIDRAEPARRLDAGTVVLIDVRPAEQYAQAHIAGAVSVPLDELATWARQAPRRKQIVAYCRGPCCGCAIQAVAELQRRGLRAARAEDGVPAWHAAGLPVERVA